MTKIWTWTIDHCHVCVWYNWYSWHYYRLPRWYSVDLKRHLLSLACCCWHLLL